MESKRNPYWYKLIKLLKERRIITTGLTVPYIFGAYELLGKPSKSIKELVAHILTSDIDKYPVIQMCGYIRQDVLMVESKQVCNRWERDVRIQSPNGKNMLFISSNTYLGNNFDSVCSTLENRYGARIKNNTYSYNYGKREWLTFTKEEEEIILSIK